MSALLSPHLRHLRAAGCSPATIHDRERLLTCADQALPHGIDHARPDEIEDFLAHQGWAPWTRRTYYNHLRAFYDWATDEETDPGLDRNPIAKLARPKSPDDAPHPVTDEELAYALANSDERWQRVIALAAYAGLRAGEIRRCQRQHITAKRVRIVLGKGRKTAEVPTHDEIWRRVADLPPGPAAVPAHYRLSTRAREHFDRLGLPDVHLHRFRHWYATALLRGGADIMTVKELMRHRSIQTTAAYLALVDGQRRLAIRTLPVLHGPESASSQQNAA